MLQAKNTNRRWERRQQWKAGKERDRAITVWSCLVERVVVVIVIIFLDICLIFGANYYTFNIGICVKLNLIAANDAHCFPPLYTPFPLASLCHKLPGVESNHISQLTKLINCQPCERERVRGGELFCCHKNFPCAALHSLACKLSSLLLLP